MLEIEEIYDVHVDKVYKFFYIHCFNKQVSEDLTSQVFIAFIEKSKDASIAKPTQYLYGIMRNKWIEYLREKYKQEVLSLESVEDFVGYSDDVLKTFDNDSIHKRARYYIKQLPKKQNQIAVMRFIKHMSISEITDVLGCSKSYVKTTQNRAIKSLKKLIQQPKLTEGGS